MLHTEADSLDQERKKVNTMPRPGSLLITVAIILLAITGSLYMHFTLGTSLNQTEQIWEARADYHRSIHPASTRLLTTSILDFLNHSLGIDFLTGFIVLQYTMSFLLGLLFFYYLKSLRFSNSLANIGVIILMTSYPILFAHFQPVYTWDDFWQYLALVGIFTLIFSNRSTLATIVFCLGILARDAIILCYPIYFIAMLTTIDNGRLKKYLVPLLPLLVWFIFLYFTWETPIERRWHHFEVNFIDAKSSTNTILSLILSLGFTWFTSLAASSILGGQLIKNSRGRLVLIGAVLYIPITIVTTLMLTLARETRLFFPPFLFVIPLTLWLLKEYAEPIKRFYRTAYCLPGLIWLTGSTMAGYLFTNYWYPDGLFRASPPATKIFVMINIALVLCILGPIMLKILTKPLKQSKEGAMQLTTNRIL